jgi:hypothetical protein
MAFCGEKDMALHLLKSAVEGHYCSYTALQKDPVVGPPRGTPEFAELLSAAKQCRDDFLAAGSQALPTESRCANPDIPILKEAKAEYAKLQ